MNVAILCDTTLDTNDGVQQYVKNLGRWLLNNGHQVDFLMGQSKNEGEFKGRIYSLAKNIKLWGNSNIFSTSLIPDFKLINEVSQKNYDIVHVQAPYSPIMAQVVLARLRCKKVATIHTSIPHKSLIGLFFKCLNLIQKRSLDGIDQFISVSKEAQVFGKVYLKKNSILIPNMVDLKMFKPIPGINNTKKINITYLGRLVPRKGVIYLLKAFKSIQDTVGADNVILTVAGDGPERYDLEQYAKNNNLNVDFLGYVEESDKNNVYNKADICVFPSTEGESFGIVLLEAFACAKPVVAFANPGYRKVMSRHAPRWLAKNKDINDLKIKILELINDRSLRESAGQINFNESKFYDVNTVCQQIFIEYQKLLGK